MERIGFDELKDFVSGIGTERVMITFHSIGDTDSIASAVALKEFLKNATISASDRITSNSERILRNLGYPDSTISSSFDSKAEIIILVDVNNFEECGSFSEKLGSTRKRVLIIDHHLPKPNPRDNVLSFDDESYNSASSITFELLVSLGAKISKPTAKLLAMGIISDSAEFRNSFPKTFTQIGSLLQQAGTDYASLIGELGRLAPPEVRATTLKDLFGSTILIKDNLLFVYGSTKFHAGIAADDAIRIGADVVLFNSESSDEVTFSARLRPPLDKKYGIHLGSIMSALAPKIGGTGGGHPCAAGAYGGKKSGREEFIERFVFEVLKRIKKK